MFYTAFVGDGETFNAGLHSREDLTVFGARMVGQEGDAVQIDLEVLNTASAFPGRRIFVSEDGNLLCAGYVVSNIGQVGETVTVQIVGKPSDAQERQDTLCQSLKVAPFYNALSLPDNQKNNISEILSGYPRMLNWDPRTGDVTAVDIFNPGGLHLDIEPFEESVSSSFTEPPISVKVNAVARWSQTVDQTHDLSSFTDGLQTMTAQGIVENWPRVGDTLGTGLTVVESFAREKVDIAGVPLRTLYNAVFEKTENDFEIDPFLDDEEEIEEGAFVSTLETRLVLRHLFEVRRTESCEFSVSRVLQSGLVTGGVEEIDIPIQELKPEDAPLLPDWMPQTVYEAGDFVEYNGNVWKAEFSHTSGASFSDEYFNKSGFPARYSVRRQRSFFGREAGIAFAEYMLQRARQRLMHTGRCVRVSCDAEMPENAATVQTNGTATISSPDLVGGQATGKIVEYTLNWTDGDRYMSVTIACAPGTGASDTLALSEPVVSIPNELGRINVVVENNAQVQIPQFQEPRPPAPPKLTEEDKINPPRFTTEARDKANEREPGTVSPTTIKYDPVIPSNDLEGTAFFTISGSLQLPTQYTMP